MALPTWAARLAAAIEQQLGAAHRPGETQVHEITATSSTEVEILYTAPGETQVRGFRVNADVVRSAPANISESTIGGLAFYIVHTAILEPRALSELEAADADGVRWLVTSRWLTEVT